MPRFPITLYDRPSIAAARLFEGDFTGAGRAMVAPETLAPSKMSSLGESLFGGLKKMAAGNPFLRGIMSIATDPLVIIMLFLSSKYPVVGARKLFDIGRKYAGAAHRPGLLEGLFGRAERIFAGTPIPKLMLQATKGRDAFIGKWGGIASAAYEDFRKTVGRYPNAKENLLIGAKLSGADRAGAVSGIPHPILADKIQLTGPVQSLHDKIVSFFDEFGKDVVLKLKGTKGWENRVAKIAHQSGMDPKTLIAAASGKLKGRYFPRFLVRSPELVKAYAEAIGEATGYEPREMERMVKAISRSRVAGASLPRFGVLIPNMDELRSIGRINPAAESMLKSKVAGQVEHIISGTEGKGGLREFIRTMTADHKAGIRSTDEVMGEIKNFMRSHQIMPSRYQIEIPKMYQSFLSGAEDEGMSILRNVLTAGVQERKYSVALTPVLNNYIQSMASPFVWSVEPVGAIKGLSSDKLPLGAAIAEATSKGKMNPALRDIFNQDYLQILQGMTTPSQTRGMLRWANLKLKAIQSLENPEGLAKIVPTTWKNKLIKMLTGERGSLSYLNVNAKIAGYFYHSTIGMNPASAFQNLLQPLITTMPMVGPKAFWKGLTVTTKKMGKYYTLRGQGVPSTEAISKVFPEFAAAGLGPEPMSQAILRDALEGAWHGAQALPLGAVQHGTKPWLAKLKRASMFMFTQSERFNRLVSFEAGLARAAAEVGKNKMTAMQSRDFASAVVRATQFPAGPGQMPNILLKLPAPWRQFMYFPIRYAGFLGESTLWGGAAKRNWGTMARTMLYSAVTYKALKNVMGADVSRSLMFGAMPLPQYEKSPFFPMPVMPPIAGIAGSLIEAAYKGETEPLGRVAALLAPAGVPLRRLYRTAHPRFAKWGQRTPDGKIPVYGENQALIAHKTPMQLFMRAVGIQPVSDTSEYEMTRYLLKHRDEIREFRRRYVEAIVQGDPEEAQRIQDAFKRMYPSLGPITLKKSDLKAAEDRRMMTRLQRLLRTMPKEYRPQFQDVVSTAMGGYMGGMMPAAPPPAPMMGGFSTPSGFKSPVGWPI